MNNTNVTKEYDERMQRFFHYWNQKEATDEIIETCSKELQIIIETLADYYDIASERMESMTGLQQAVWKHRMEKIKEIQTKLESSIGYNRDEQLEICRKKTKEKDDDTVGEDSMVLTARKRKG